MESKNRTRDERQSLAGGAEATPEDTLLVRKVVQGDSDALGRFAARMKCVPRILGSLNRRLGRPLDEHELADVGQEVLIVAWKKLPTFDGKASLESWVYRIAFLTLMNAMRRKRRRSVVSLGFEESGAPEREVAESPWDMERLRRSLDGLPSEERTLLELKHFQDLTFVEIGERLGVSDNTAKTRYYRARVHLQNAFERSNDSREGKSPAGGKR